VTSVRAQWNIISAFFGLVKGAGACSNVPLSVSFFVEITSKETFTFFDEASTTENFASKKRMMAEIA